MTMKEIAKKIIASINPGIADISNIGDGTIKGAISELNKNIGIFQYEESDTGGVVQPGSWFKIPNFTIDLSDGVYAMSFWIRSQGGGSMNTNYNTPFSVSVGLSESTSFNDDAIAGCLNKNWSIASCSKYLKLDSPKKYNLFLKHDAKESHKIDFRIDIVKIR